MYAKVTLATSRKVGPGHLSKELRDIRCTGRRELRGLLAYSAHGDLELRAGLNLPVRSNAELLAGTAGLASKGVRGFWS